MTILLLAMLAAVGAAPRPVAIAACGDITKSGTYILTKNVSSAGTCFFIDADNVKLSLGGHTVTYGTGGGTLATPGVLLADPWFHEYNLAQSGSTEHHGGFVMYGGSVVSSPNAAPRSTAIWVGQSNDIAPAPVLHNLTLTTTAEDASPIFGTISAPGWKIYSNNISYTSKLTSSRYDFYGYAIWIGDDLNALGADQIYSNTILAAPQGGIYDDRQAAYIHNNDITFNSFYANDYCVIDYAGDDQLIYENLCHPVSGRGIDVEAKNTQAVGNIITVTELPQVAEYNGCEGGGADGIRVRDNSADSGNGNNAPSNPTGVVISGNTITVSAAQCQGVGLRLTSLQPNDDATFENNVVKTAGGVAGRGDYGISLDGDAGPVLTWSGDTFTSVYAWTNIAWDGSSTSAEVTGTWSGKPLFAVDSGDGGSSATVNPSFLTISGSGTVNCQASSTATVTAGGIPTHC